MKRVLQMLLVCSLILAPFAGCTTKEQPVVTPDAVSSATEKESADPAALLHGLSEDGYWIFALLDDVTLTEALNVDGMFYDKDDTSSKIYRKLALYAQDADHKVTAEYTLTVPEINVTSPNFRIQNGTVIGDIYVEAEGFELKASTVEGNIYFASQALMDAALLEEGTVTGEIALAG